MAGRPKAAPASRPQSREEEVANSLSHGLGLAAALAAGAFLIVAAIQRGDRVYLASVGVYVTTLVFLYLASTVYHALPQGGAKSAWLVGDHAAVFLFIAGTYTPFALGVLRGSLGLALLGGIWSLALAGIAFKIIGGAASYPRFSTAVYLGMGWGFLAAAGPVWRLMPVAGWLWLLAGGLAYSIGVAFFRAERLRYMHFVWHWFVLAGTACHFIAVVRYAGGA
jgi:hemolysin III